MSEMASSHEIIVFHISGGANHRVIGNQPHDKEIYVKPWGQQIKCPHDYPSLHKKQLSLQKCGYLNKVTAQVSANKVYSFVAAPECST